MAFSTVFLHDNFWPEVGSDVAAVEWIDLDSRVEFGDSGSNRSRDIRTAHFVMDDERTTPAIAGYHIRPNAIPAFCLIMRTIFCTNIREFDRFLVKLGSLILL